MIRPRPACLALLVLFTSAVPAVAQPTGDLFRMALAGDAIITRRLSPYREPEFLRMVELIRAADVGIVNLEVLFHDYEPWPAHRSGGTYMRAEPALADELVWAGFDLVSLANNHTGDYGVEGQRLTEKYVREAGLVAAGTGENLFAAREARFLETHGGRVALISVASTFTEHSVAGKPRGAVRGRPGLNPLRYSSQRVVTREQIEAIRTGLVNAGMSAGQAGSNRLSVFGEVLTVGEEPGTRTTPNEEDMAEIAAVVHGASRLADYVVVTIHSHETGRQRGPADFLVTFAHAMIDAGADAFFGHGPHYLRGIEIYNGKPIFYSLGDFVFQNETLQRLPFENFASYDLDDLAQVADFNAERYSNDTRGFPANREIWESVIAIPVFRGETLVKVELHPITLGFGQPPAHRGRPMLADPELGQKIINDLIERSERFGTEIQWAGGIGEVIVPGDSAGDPFFESAESPGDARVQIGDVRIPRHLRPRSHRHCLLPHPNPRETKTWWMRPVRTCRRGRG
jgi:poly-gamma-glutamate synthesis protein (capsule biosynthesis protein)